MTPIERLVTEAGPKEPQPLASLLDRLAAEDLRTTSEPAELGAVRVFGVTEDSRQAGAGRLFVAVPGFHVDGHDFAGRAAASGAAAAIVEHEIPGLEIPQIVVRDARRSLAAAAGWWYGDPSQRLGVVGITGTDGKTTTSFLATAALEACGLRTGLIGTVETRLGGLRERHEAHVTTPAAPELQATLAAMASAGDDVAVVETTSHALELGRVLGIAYDAAIFTNLTHEHLELHGTFERYREAKTRLFSALAQGAGNPPKWIGGRPWPKVAVINADDPNRAWFERAADDAGAKLIR